MYKKKSHLISLCWKTDSPPKLRAGLSLHQASLWVFYGYFSSNHVIVKAENCTMDNKKNTEQYWER